MARKPVPLAKLDATTPKWPELRVQFDSDGPATIFIAGIGHTLDPDDPHGDAVRRATEVAAQQHAPIRLTSADVDRTTVRMIITTDGQVHMLETARPAGAAPSSTSTAKPSGKKTKATKQSSGTGPLARMSPRLRGTVKWGGLAFAALVAASVVVVIADPGGRSNEETAAPIIEHPPAPAGQLYTEYAPPSWDATATWVLPIADNAQPVVDHATGTIAVVTPNDRTTTETDAATANLVEGRRPGWLSILEPDGRTRWTYPLDRRVQFGPAIVNVDGTTSVVIGTSASSITYWPLTGGQPVTLDLPAGVTGQLNVDGDNLMANLSDERLAVLRAGRFDVFQALPRTTALYAIGSTIVSIQPETGTWWTQQAGTDPIPTEPQQPAGADKLDSILASTPAHVILAWATTEPDGTGGPDIITAHDRSTGRTLDTITPEVPVPAGAGTGWSNPAGTITAAAGLILTDNTLQDIPQLRIETIQDNQVHGTLHGDPVVITNGRTTATTAATLIPAAATSDHLLVISQRQLYALPRAGG